MQLMTSAAFFSWILSLDQTHVSAVVWVNFMAPIPQNVNQNNVIRQTTTLFDSLKRKSIYKPHEHFTSTTRLS